MDLVYLVVFGVTVHLSSGVDLQPGLCSRSCQNNTSSSDQSDEDIRNLLKFPCSCSSSCSLYGDCCYDSPFRSKGTGSLQLHTMCLPLSRRGVFRAVAKCPKDWPGSSQFCTASIGHLPPVTSKATGTTYANIFCASCHDDVEDVTTWNVELRCCPEHKGLDTSRGGRYRYRNGKLWSSLPNGRKCFCNYYAHFNDYSFMDDLELRTCAKKTEIAKCSSTWTGYSEKELCASFLDPIYIGSKVYRNQYCAMCNYARNEIGKCLPDVVRQMLSSDLTFSEIIRYCRQHELNACRHFFSSFSSGKGRSYPYSLLMSIREYECLPDPGKKCCEGERYDWRANRCRKVNSKH